MNSDNLVDFDKSFDKSTAQDALEKEMIELQNTNILNKKGASMYDIGRENLMMNDLMTPVTGLTGRTKSESEFEALMVD